MNDKEINNYIISSLWKLFCYFGEKGNEIFRDMSVNISKGFENDNSFYSMNILLTGMSTSGKSSFVNLMSGKLVALEKKDYESSSVKTSEYYIYIKDENNEHGVIKLIDTSGICENEYVRGE